MADVYTADQLEAISRERAIVKVLVTVFAAAPPATSSFKWNYCTGDYYGAYDSRGLSISGIGRGPASLAKLTIKIDNRDKSLGADMAAAVRTVGATCSVSLVTQESNGIFGNAVTLIDGWIVRASVGDDVSLEASVLYGQRREASLMKGSRNCGNAFTIDGSKLCQYSGVDDTCLRTEADCITHHGDLRYFNGFPDAPKPGDTINIGDSSVKIPSSMTNFYFQRSGWQDSDGALKDPTGPRRFIADGFLEDPKIDSEPVAD